MRSGGGSLRLAPHNEVPVRTIPQTQHEIMKVSIQQQRPLSASSVASKRALLPTPPNIVIPPGSGGGITPSQSWASHPPAPVPSSRVLSGGQLMYPEQRGGGLHGYTPAAGPGLLGGMALSYPQNQI